MVVLLHAVKDPTAVVLVPSPLPALLVSTTAAVSATTIASLAIMMSCLSAGRVALQAMTVSWYLFLNYFSPAFARLKRLIKSLLFLSLQTLEYSAPDGLTLTPRAAACGVLAAVTPSATASMTGLATTATAVAAMVNTLILVGYFALIIYLIITNKL